jgi:bile acid:Na+ symporter, BASS family
MYQPIKQEKAPNIESSIITNILLPVALGIIMLGLGLSLTVEDFKRVVRYPKAVLVGLFIQMFVLTGICFGICVLLKLPSTLAVGMMLLAAAPGGATANIYSHLAKGDVALNITLTAVNSVLSLLTLPFIVGFALQYFMGNEQVVPPPFKKVLEVGVIILGPVIIGMLIRAKAVNFAAKMEKPIRLFSILLLATLVIMSVAQSWTVVVASFASVGLACLLFNLASMGVGYAVPLAVKLPKRQAIAIAMEIGIHNGTLAIYIALNIIGNNIMSIPAAIYSLIMFLTAALFAAWLNRRPV